MPRAAGLADEIEKKTGIKPSLVKGQDGVFEVELDGEVVFSKKALGRFPEAGEVEGALEERLAAG